MKNFAENVSNFPDRQRIKRKQKKKKGNRIKRKEIQINEN